MKADRAIGSERKRSRTPSLRSLAMDVAGPMTPKTRVWMKIPPIRYSW